MGKRNKSNGFQRTPITLSVNQDRSNVNQGISEGDYLNKLTKEKLKKSKQPNATTQDNQNDNKNTTNYTGSAFTQNNDGGGDDSTNTSDPAPAPVQEPPQPQTISLTQDQLQEMFDTAARRTAEPLQQKIDQQQQEVENLNSQLGDRNNEVKELNGKLNESNQQLQTAQDELKTSEEKRAELDESVTKATETINHFQDLYKLTGSQVPKGSLERGNQNSSTNFNKYTSANGDHYEGALAEFFQIQDSLPKARKNTSRGVMFYACDPRQLDAFVREHKKEVLIEMTNHGRKHGLFQGRVGRVVTQAATTSGDIPGGFLDVLSSLARLSNRPGFVFHQFADTVIEFDKGLGDNVQVYRAAYPTRPADPNDRLLSGGGTYARISTGGDNIQTGVRNVTLKEWGLGKDGVSNPLELPNFVQSYSMIELMNIIERNLMFDYYSWEDLAIRSIWTPTSRVLYNNSYTPTTDPTQVIANSSGTMQRGFLTSTYGYMQDLGIVPLPDGCYILVMPTTAATQFKNELDKDWEAPSPQALQEFSNMMYVNSYGDEPRVTGYIGKFCDFHIFATNAYGVGVAGTEGVQNVTDGVGSAVYRSSYAAGANTIARGIGTAMEIRRDTNDDFQRLNRYIWRSEEGFDPLDVDPTGYSDTDPVPQELRVLELRTRDLAA